MSTHPSVLRPALAPIKLFAFDLDDTLHSFRPASAAAATAVFQNIATRLPSPSADAIPSLRASYAAILRRHTAHAFADGRSSTAYRKDRFAALLAAAGLDDDDGADESYLDELAATYKTALRAALRAKPGAREVLEGVRGAGRRAVVVTEGPRDAQVWTLRELGLWGLVDGVVTTGEVGRGKVEEGFWGAVLGLVGDGVGREEVCVVGDSWERDVVPARAAECVGIWFCEGGWEGEGRDGLRVDSLERLREVV